ncbi:ribose-5-phosphate isomerase RpiA [Flavihumibacter petaseus]|uniref:Ribose-5-phosphate isomerase A n=1 Tax=Flavihumibacter petaseus NBRC 106054 TaxID=1220578 RepID=A0A0E9N261_9BACT|nr:ribose-5-phosphate isomerase RpiA [Flavihumibacter petaseus]GAO43400.1 ribose-5-phosphate isomerase A [Flavihumibacter petaseus NBRC 106054]
MLSNDDIKKNLGFAAADYVSSGMTIGAGTGTTAYWFLQALGEKVKQGLDVVAVPTSTATANLLIENNVPLKTLNEVDKIDLVLDGADEIDPAFRLIKGGGGAHLQEKMVAAAADRMIVLADASKLVSQLGRFPLPVEVVPFGYRQVQQKIAKTYGIDVTVREKFGAPFISDHGHYILDCHFGTIADPLNLHAWLNQIPGVVENGLFLQYATATLIGYPDGNIIFTPNPQR